MDTLTIESNDLAEFLKQVVDAAKNGYSLSMHVDHYPREYLGINHKVVVMVKDQPKEEVVVKPTKAKDQPKE